MCSRFTLTARLKDLYEAFAIVPASPVQMPGSMQEPAPRYNIAPTQPILIAVTGPSGARELMLVRWGLIPSWVKDPRDFSLLVNARAETAADKPSFRNAMRHRRVLVPANGFYEWRRPVNSQKGGGKGRGEPFLLRPRDGGLIFLAGLMETWSSPDGSEIDTGAILTVAANRAVAQVHDRMPVIIKPEDVDRWLDCMNYEPREMADLLVPADPDLLEIIPLGDRVNRVANTGPDIQEPAGPPLTLPKADEGPAVTDDDNAHGNSAAGQLKLL
ncbi:MAG: SOS response-associated peptidase [Salaquimonas sp.]|nr:SOS response-associated peptidase [Salaquimonas sp.]